MTRRGRPRLANEPTLTLSVRITTSTFDFICQEATRLRTTPAELVRRVLAAERKQQLRTNKSLGAVV